MESATINNSVNAIKEARKLLMMLEITFLMKKQRELEKNFIEYKLSIVF